MKLIDSSAWIEYLRPGQSEIGDGVELLINSNEAAWCDIIAMELANSTKSQQLLRLEKVQRMAWCVETNTLVWNLARKLVHDARRAGVTAPLPDYIVFACAKIHGLEIMHKRDKDFLRLEAVYRSF